ncbi:MAG: metallopeptidase family protein [Oscillospiraceae bacterium]|nr:metallopeptidase family protein [Oscillospiraceae bacterium]
MISFEEAGAVLDEIADSLPAEFFRELNGGILLAREVCRRDDLPGGLYTMGVYRHDHTGRSIEIYYGSFAALYPRESASFWRGELRRTLLHEFTHHLESLGGEKTLERQDEEELEQYWEEWLGNGGNA